MCRDRTASNPVCGQSTGLDRARGAGERSECLQIWRHFGFHARKPLLTELWPVSLARAAVHRIQESWFTPSVTTGYFWPYYGPGAFKRVGQVSPASLGSRGIATWIGPWSPIARVLPFKPIPVHTIRGQSDNRRLGPCQERLVPATSVTSERRTTYPSLYRSAFTLVKGKTPDSLAHPSGFEPKTLCSVVR